MKKFRVFTIVLGALVMASMVSCTKDGVYNPKKKIQRTYYSSTNTDKYMATSWEWDGNLLQAINHYGSGGGLSWTENYTYDGKRVIRVDSYTNSEYATYEYDGKNLKSINFYYRSQLEATAVYAYADGKLSTISMTIYDAKKSKGERHLLASLLPFPTEVTEAVNKCVKSMTNNAAKDIETYTMQLTWTGKNVTKIVITEQGNMRTISLQYDDKTNPTKGFYDLATIENFGDYYFSENNVTRMINTWSDGYNDVLNLTYQYDNDGWPTMRIRQYEGESLQSIDYYEYK